MGYGIQADLPEQHRVWCAACLYGPCRDARHLSSAQGGRDSVHACVRGECFQRRGGYCALRVDLVALLYQSGAPLLRSLPRAVCLHFRVVHRHRHGFSTLRGAHFQAPAAGRAVNLSHRDLSHACHVLYALSARCVAAPEWYHGDLCGWHYYVSLHTVEPFRGVAHGDLVHVPHACLRRRDLPLRLHRTLRGHDRLLRQYLSRAVGASSVPCRQGPQHLPPGACSEPVPHQ
mmetsp:Transcript_23340/g.45349  ORF Transcript_23340/g.45349 Transcript_23340/m.45349 type:complete len:231 (+) Transcript_23340:716-1408(+)